MIPVDELPAFISTAEANAFARSLERQSYDGIAIKISHLAAAGEQVAPCHFVAFRPEQVVLADEDGAYRQGAYNQPP